MSTSNIQHSTSKDAGDGDWSGLCAAPRSGLQANRTCPRPPSQAKRSKAERHPPVRSGPEGAFECSYGCRSPAGDWNPWKAFFPSLFLSAPAGAAEVNVVDCPGTEARCRRQFRPPLPGLDFKRQMFWRPAIPRVALADSLHPWLHSPAPSGAKMVAASLPDAPRINRQAHHNERSSEAGGPGLKTPRSPRLGVRSLAAQKAGYSGT